MIHVAAYTIAETPQCFLVDQTTPKIAPCRGILVPILSLFIVFVLFFFSTVLVNKDEYNTWFLGPTRVNLPKSHLDRFSRFCRAHERDQQTDRHTDRVSDHTTPSVATGRIRIAAMRPKN